MSLFRKDLQEHYDFFTKCYDYILAKHALSKAGAMRFASVSDLMSLSILEKFYNSVSEKDLNKRLAAVQPDLASLGTKLKLGLRREFGVPIGLTFSQFKKENKENEEFNEKRNEFKKLYLSDPTDKEMRERIKERGLSEMFSNIGKFAEVISFPLINKVTAAAKAIANSRLKGKLTFDEAEDAARDAVMKFLSGTAPTSLVDYLVDFPSNKSLEDIVTMYTSLITRSQLNTEINEILKNKGISLDESLEGKDDSSTTRGEQLVSEEKSVEEEAMSSPLDPIRRFVKLYGQSVRQLERRMQNLDPRMDANQIKILQLELQAAQAKVPLIESANQTLDRVDELLRQKKYLFEVNKSKILSEDEIAAYSSVSESLSSALGKVMELIENIAPQSATEAVGKMQEQINEIASEYVIPGLEPEPIAEIAEPEGPEALEDIKKPKRPRAKGIPAGMTQVSPQAYQAFMDSGQDYLSSLMPDLYSGLHYGPGSELQSLYGRGPLRKITQAVPYARGLQTKAQLEALQSGDPDAMTAAGVDPISQFKRELLELMNEQNLNYIWQQSGRTIPGEEVSKKSSRKIFNRKLEALREDPRFQNIPEIVGPGGMIDQYLKTPGPGQEVFDQFDMVRRTAEYMRVLRESGKTSFSELTDEDIEQGASNAIDREGSHYGETQAMWLKGHKPYFGLSPEVMKAIMVRELQKLRAESSSEGKNPIKFQEIDMPDGSLQQKNIGYKGRQRAVSPEATPNATPDLTPDVEASSRRFKRFANAENTENVDFMVGPEDLLKMWRENPELRAEISGLFIK